MSYALCDDRRTLLWFANQRAVEYHPTLVTAGRPEHRRPTWCSTSTRPRATPSRAAVAAARLVRQALADVGLAGAVKTSGAKGVHVFVPVTDDATAEDAAAATRAIAARAERLDPALATTAFIREDRGGKVFVDATRAGGATVVAAYSPRVRPGAAGLVPGRLGRPGRVTPADFTIRTAPACSATADPWAERDARAAARSPPTWWPRAATIPVARVQAMHEGKRRARARREAG